MSNSLGYINPAIPSLGILVGVSGGGFASLEGPGSPQPWLRDPLQANILRRVVTSGGGWPLPGLRCSCRKVLDGVWQVRPGDLQSKKSSSSGLASVPQQWRVAVVLQSTVLLCTVGEVILLLERLLIPGVEASRGRIWAGFCTWHLAQSPD